MESATGALLGSLAGVNMISGAGMLAYENCQSPEKLILDSEMIASIKHFSTGIQFRENPLAIDIIREVGTTGDFISHEHTLKWFKEEVHYPSPIIDRQPLDPADQRDYKSAWTRAQDRRQELLKSTPEPALPSDIRDELKKITARAAQSEGMDILPPYPVILHNWWKKIQFFPQNFCLLDGIYTILHHPSQINPTMLNSPSVI